MDFNDTKQEAEFRKKCFDWLSENAKLKQDEKSDEMFGDDKFLEKAKKWQKKKYDAGYAMIHWPKEFGGLNASPIERIIWSEEESKFDVPRGVYDIGLGMCGPVMMQYASNEQKQRFLPPMAEGTEIWCQLFSEPSAGSDVAGLRTKAVKDGDKWIINGQKVWTSGAHFSDYGILVARHDINADKHKGLTFFFLDMHSPGIEVKPIKQITGGSSFNEVYFNDVVIPDSQRLGEIGEGWKVSLTTLMNERLAVGDAVGSDVEDLFKWAKKHTLDDNKLIEDTNVRSSIADWYCEASGLKNTKLRTVSSLSRGETPGPEASITKIVSANKLQNIGIYGMDTVETAGIIKSKKPELKGFHNAWLAAPGLRIAGGTDEILKNIIAERVLMLPQETREDKNKPFKDIPTGKY